MIVYLYYKYNAFMLYLYLITKNNNYKNVYSCPIGINKSYQYITNIHPVHLNYFIIFVYL